MKDKITRSFEILQDEICAALEEEDGSAKFREDAWQRPGGGGGKSRVINNGKVIEKGGVNFSAVFGQAPERMVSALRLKEGDFYATGVSIVLHPENPHVPIIHMNVRYFEMDDGTWWFGGGIDLTPHYVNLEDAHYFHQHLKNICDKHDQEYYLRFKRWADDYFYIAHRKETRGVGGIFFDHLNDSTGKSKEEIFSFVLDVGLAFAPIYRHFMHAYKHVPYSDREKQWQLLRRGRYVEFNLVLDKGTKFGLETEGRTESILMSMPPLASWIYDLKPEANSEEARTLKWLKKDIDWINMTDDSFPG